MEEWKEIELREITELVIDYRGKTPHKLGRDWSDHGFRALSAKNIKTGRLVNENDVRYVDEELYHLWMKDEVKRGDILITSEAPFGQVYFWDSDEKIVLSQRLFDVRLSSSVDHRYVYYYMTSRAFQGELDSRSSGTTVVGLRQPELLKCKIALPKFDTQRKIANILKAFDEKISINNRINKNLEEQAQALYRSWFVVFEPFQDRSFVQSVFGLIPNGWRVGKLSDLVDIQKNSISKVNVCGRPYLPIDLIPIRSFSVEDFAPSTEAQSSLQVFSKNDILIGAMRVYFHRVVPAPCEGVTRNTCFVLRPKFPELFAYALLTCNQDSTIAFAQNTSKGSTMPYAVWDGTLSEMRILIPDHDTILRFNSIISPIIEMIQSNARINRNLRLLRENYISELFD